MSVARSDISAWLKEVCPASRSVIHNFLSKRLEEMGCAEDQVKKILSDPNSYPEYEETS